MEFRLYILDFDGVICDSQYECMITSYNAYRSLYDPKFSKCFESHVVPEDYKIAFLKNRFLVRIAEEYKLLWDLIIAGQDIMESVPIRKQTNVDPAELRGFRELFFQVRQIWIDQDFELWLRSNPLYGEIVPNLKKWAEEQRLFIISAKDKQSILRILKFNGLNIQECFIHGEREHDKFRTVRAISRENSDSDLTFIDDNLDNVLFPAESRVTNYLADWGYSSEFIIRKAEKAGILILSLKQFCSLC